MPAGSRLYRFGLVLVFALCGALTARVALAADGPPRRNLGPWNEPELRAVPSSEWGAAADGVQSLYYEGAPYRGQSTRVFAYYARPKEGTGPWPAMVLLHGGGGRAFAEWARLWADRGYVALAMDLAGNGPDGKRLPDGGPPQDDKTKFADFTDEQVRDMWTFHAVAAAIKAHSLLAAQKEVDAKRIGVTGISWGGYLTCLVAGVDDRFQAAVPVYGCGFLHENSVWLAGHFEKMRPAQRDRWVKNFDPSSYLAGVGCPILFVNGTNDFAYPLDSYQKSYNLVDGKLRNLCVTVNMPHGHAEGWAPKEIGLFVDSALKDAPPLARCGAVRVAAKEASVEFTATEPIASASLHYTTDDGPWHKRQWTTVPAAVRGDRASAKLDSGSTYFFTVVDRRGAIVSSPHYDFATK